MKLRFQGLTELRGIAALMVFISHFELLKYNEGIQSTLYNTVFNGFIHSLGKSGVHLFFVLSGFLITSLLLTEIKNTGTISLTKFYIRRTLRIWPLYYLIVLFYFFALPGIGQLFEQYSSSHSISRIVKGDTPFFQQFLMYMMFLPNLASVVFTNPKALASFCWSIGVEEQFYLFWPFLLLFFRNNIRIVICMVPVLKLIVYLSFIYLIPHFYYHSGFNYILNFLRSFNIELMAFGGILAYAVKNGFTLENRFNKMHSVLIIITIFICLFFEVSYLLISLLYVLLIALSINQKTNIFQNKKLEWVGEISYGLYMFHPVSQFIAFVLVEQTRLDANDSPVAFTILLLTLSILITFFICTLSYKYMESPLLRLKEKYAVVSSSKN